jgi:hypothetical protein
MREYKDQIIRHRRVPRLLAPQLLGIGIEPRLQFLLCALATAIPSQLQC